MSRRGHPRLSSRRLAARRATAAPAGFVRRYRAACLRRLAGEERVSPTVHAKVMALARAKVLALDYYKTLALCPSLFRDAAARRVCHRPYWCPSCWARERIYNYFIRLERLLYGLTHSPHLVPEFADESHRLVVLERTLALWQAPRRGFGPVGFRRTLAAARGVLTATRLGADYRRLPAIAGVASLILEVRRGQLRLLRWTLGLAPAGSLPEARLPRLLAPGGRLWQYPASRRGLVAALVRMHRYPPTWWNPRIWRRLPAVVAVLGSRSTTAVYGRIRAQEVTLDPLPAHLDTAAQRAAAGAPPRRRP